VADVPLFDLRHQNRDLKRARFIPTFLISHLESVASLAPFPIEAAKLAGINRSGARSPNGCGIAQLSIRAKKRVQANGCQSD
jgi:hypothetical protein